MHRSCGTIDQKRFRRAANAGAPHLGIDRNLAGHVEIGGLVDIKMANAFQMREDRHPRFRLNARNKAFSTTRHDHINRTVQTFQHFTNSGPVGHWHDLDRIGWQAGCFEPLTSAL